MIEILPIKEKNKIIGFYNENNLIYSENSSLVIARFGEDVLGYAAFDLFDDKIVITDISPLNDIMLADGILRSALHVADFNGIFEAFYSNSTLTELLNKLNFIKDSEKMSINIEKLHESCCNAEKSCK